MMTTVGAHAPAAASRQEVEQLIGFLGEGPRELARIEAIRDDAIAAATEAAEAKSQPIKTALTEAQSKVQAWCKANPGALPAGFTGDVSSPEAYQAQLAAMLMASARPLTKRQRSILERMRDEAMVLRRRYGHRSYTLSLTDRPALSAAFVSSAHVFDLQHRFLDAYDPATGEPLLGVSGYDDRDIEFRIKPGVVLP